MWTITRGRLWPTVLLATAGLTLPAIACGAPGVAAAARTTPAGHATSPRHITPPGHRARRHRPAHRRPATPLGPAACPAPRAFSSLPLFAHIPGADDVMAASNGDVWVSNVGGHQLTELSPAGAVIHIFGDRSNPEGMVQLTPTTMALANQGNDRLVVFNMTTGKSTRWVQLTPNGNLGVDGLGMAPGLLLLPDSAQGALDTVPLPALTGGARTIAAGLGRPVDATPAGDGTLLVSVENPPGLDRVNPATGSVTPAAHFASTDDVAVRGGIAYVANIGGGTLSAVTLASGKVSTLVTGVSDAQGLAMRAGGSFLLTDETSGDIRVAPGC